MGPGVFCGQREPWWMTPGLLRTSLELRQGANALYLAEPELQSPTLSWKPQPLSLPRGEPGNPQENKGQREDPTTGGTQRPRMAASTKHGGGME